MKTLLRTLASSSVVLLALSAVADNGMPEIAPSSSKPGGQTYGRWAATWQVWAQGVPLATSPLTDLSGENCGERQVDEVWFLAGVSYPSSTPPASVVRHCDVPAGKSLFFPLINTSYGAFLNDPPATRTEAYARAAASCSQSAQISLTIDGNPIPKSQIVFTGASGSQSPIFNVQLPPGNFFGLHDVVNPDPNPGLAAEELVLSPSAEQGYYVFVYPMSRGAHTISWKAKGCSPYIPPQNVTYYLNVK
jgi:hypothetical protein